MEAVDKRDRQGHSHGHGQSLAPSASQPQSQQSYSVSFADFEEFLSEDLYELSDRLPISALAFTVMCK